MEGSEKYCKFRVLEVAVQFRSAYTGSGFAYVSRHGFPMELMGRLFEASRAFFEGHSVEEKKAAFPWDQVRMWGYVAPNAESLDSLREEGTEPVR